MKKRKILIVNRLFGKKRQTIGRAMLINEQFLQLFSFVTLELGWLLNEIGESCVKNGNYELHVRYSEKYGRHLHIKDVEGRAFILFHWGNFNWDTQGCVLVGEKFSDINKDGDLDITKSKKTFKKLMSFIKDDDIINFVFNEIIINQ